jgi:hypothetical protein
MSCYIVLKSYLKELGQDLPKFFNKKLIKRVSCSYLQTPWTIDRFSCHACVHVIPWLPGQNQLYSLNLFKIIISSPFFI